MSEVHDRKLTIAKRAINFWQCEPQLSVLCGGIAGALSRTAVSPIERVKVLYQVQGTTNSYSSGTLRTVYQIWKEEGYKGLFRGNGINCIRIVPYSAVQYSVYQEMKAWLARRRQKKYNISHPEDPVEDSKLHTNTVDKLLAGTVAGFASVVATYPMDLVKTRLSIQTARSLKNLNAESPNQKGIRPLGMFGSIREIYLHEGGVRALYRGVAPTTLGVAPYAGLNFAIYENMRNAVPLEHRKNPFIILSLGGLSGGIAQTLVYPFDILRRRFQVATLQGGKMGFQYSSVWDALKTIVAKEGWRGLYKGWQANMWKIMPSMAVQWTSYDLIKKFIEER